MLIFFQNICRIFYFIIILKEMIEFEPFVSKAFLGYFSYEIEIFQVFYVFFYKLKGVYISVDDEF